MEKVEKDGWQDRLAASEWTPCRLRVAIDHGGRAA
jgi:hypothetical protein